MTVAILVIGIVNEDTRQHAIGSAACNKIESQEVVTHFLAVRSSATVLTATATRTNK